MKAEDAKDVALHVRRIHFALIVICLGLIFLSLVAHAPELDIARQQVLDIIELKNRERGTLIRHLLESRASLPQKLLEIQPDGTYVTESASFLLPESGLVRVVDKTHELWETPLGVESLEEFAHLWDLLDGISSVPYVTSFADKALVELFDPENTDVGLPIAYPKAVFKNAETGITYHPRASSYRPLRYPFEHPREIEPFTYGLELISSTSTDLHGRTKGHRVMLPAQVEFKSFSPQHLLVSKHDDVIGHWRLGTFANCFPELARASRKYSDLKLERIKDIIEDEQERRGTEIQLYGAKVSSATFTRFGVLLLLGVYAYFLVHLDALRLCGTKLSQSITVPWILLYGTRTSKSFSVLTACCLPILAVVAVLYATVPPWWIWLVTLIVTVAISILVAVLLICIWKSQLAR